jgi:hypothetical protein
MVISFALCLRLKHADSSDTYTWSWGFWFNFRLQVPVSLLSCGFPMQAKYWDHFWLPICDPTECPVTCVVDPVLLNNLPHILILCLLMCYWRGMRLPCLLPYSLKWNGQPARFRASSWTQVHLTARLICVCMCRLSIVVSTACASYSLSARFWLDAPVGFVLVSFHPFSPIK